MAARKRRRGMTLMEIMIVIAIVVMLMGALTVGLRGMWGDARRMTAELEAQRIVDRLQVARVRGPLDDRALAAITRELRPDPWGRPYRITHDGDELVVMSDAADGRPGGEGEDEDVRVSTAPTR